MCFKRILEKQFRRPSGLFGRIVAIFMARVNREMTASTIRLLDVQPTDCVLEIGFGPGHAIEQVSHLARHVEGIDFSETMLAAASRRNAKAIRDGRVRLQQGEATHLPYENDAFDKIFTANTIYFFADATPFIGEMCRVLKPGGKFVIAFSSDTELRQRGVSEDNSIFHIYSGEQVVQMIENAGCQGSFEVDEDSGAIYVTAAKALPGSS